MKKLIIVSSIAFVLSACSSSVAFKEQWDNYESERLSTSKLADNQALAVFYRTADFQAPALNVYVNGDYQASLLDKSFTPVTVCANNQLISTSYSSTHQFGNRTQGNRHNLAAK